MTVEFIPLMCSRGKSPTSRHWGRPTHGSFCSPHVTIINYPGRPAGMHGGESELGTATTENDIPAEVDPIAIQIPDEARTILDEILKDTEPDAQDPDDD